MVFISYSVFTEALVNIFHNNVNEYRFFCHTHRNIETLEHTYTILMPNALVTKLCRVGEYCSRDALFIELTQHFHKTC